MKTLKILGLIMIAGILFSCEEEVNDDLKTQDVEFSINQIDPTSNLKDGDFNFNCLTDDEGNLIEPEWAYVEISTGDNGDVLTFEPEVFYLENGNLYTQAIKLQIPDGHDGKYDIKKFLLMAMVDGKKTVIMATPEVGSEYGSYINKPIAFEFEVKPLDKVEVPIEVLCFEPGDYEKFGFFWFNVISQTVVREICFFGDLCTKNSTDYDGSYYNQELDFTLSEYPFDLPAIFKIKAYKNGELYDTFENIDKTNPDEWEYKGVTCVKYPDVIGERDVFEFELYVYVKVGDGFDYLKFHKWKLADELLNEIGNSGGIIEFIIGSCGEGNLSYPNVKLPPYLNLPTTAEAKITFNYDSGGYWEIMIGSVSPVSTSYDFPATGTYLGWCGDAYQIINPGEATFNTYSSLNAANWPAGIPVSIEDLAEVNWLMNNLTDFDYPALSGMFVETGELGITEQQAKDLQHAIWLILGFDPNNTSWPVEAAGGGTPSQAAIDIAAAANAINGFVPLPGGYAAVLMVKNNDPANFQLIFTLVDP